MAFQNELFFVPLVKIRPMKLSSFCFLFLLIGVLFACGVDYNPEKSKAEKDAEREWKRQKMLHSNGYSEQSETNEEDVSEVSEIEEEAAFPGGQDAMARWLQMNMNYPEKELDQGIGGRVYLRFVVSTKGNISNVTVSRGVSPALDREAVRAVRSMPRWKPGTINGQPVNMWYNLPIKFTPG